MSNTCLICNRTLGRNFRQHLKSKHNISVKDYYDKYLKSPTDGVCKLCSATTEFVYECKRILRYNAFCSKSCSFKFTHIEIQNSEDRRLKWSNRSRETMNNMWDNPELRSDNWGKARFKWVSNGGTNFRSSWELRFSRQMTELGMKWLYEPRTFKMSNGKRYTPDFFLPEFNMYIEITPKAFMEYKVLVKIPEVRKYGFKAIVIHEGIWDYVIDVFREKALSLK